MTTENTDTPGGNGTSKKSRRPGRPKGSKNKAASTGKTKKKRQRKDKTVVYKLSDGTVLPPPDQLPAAYLFECAKYAHELQSKLPSFTE